MRYAWLCFSLILAASAASAQITMDRVVVSAGGGTMSNGPLQMDLTIGQPVVGSSQDRPTKGDFGFWWQVVPITTEVDHDEIPMDFALRQNTPNPFSTHTTITYALPRGPMPVFIGIFNLQGGLVRTLVQESQSAGTFTVSWDGRDDNGLYLAAGVYFTKIRAGSYQRTAKTVMLK